MAIPTWQASGQYYETCSCDFVCPCLPGGMAVRPSKGSCTFAMAFEISHGNYGTVSLDGLGFIVLGFTPGAMAEGDWSVGLIADERASAEQQEAITAIASGTAGGPMAALSGLIRKFLGVQRAPIRFDRTGAKWSVKASDFVDMAAEGVKGLNPDATEPMHLDNTGPSGRRSLRVGACRQASRACPRFDMGRRQRHEQRTVRAVFLAQRVARRCRALRPRLRHHRDFRR